MAKPYYDKLYPNVHNIKKEDVYNGNFDAVHFKKKKESDFVKELQAEERGKMSPLKQFGLSIKDGFLSCFNFGKKSPIDSDSKIVDFKFMKYSNTEVVMEFCEDLGSHSWSILVIEDLPPHLLIDRKGPEKNPGQIVYYQAYIGDAITYVKNIAKSKDTHQIIMVKRSLPGYNIMLGIIDRLNTSGTLNHIKQALLDDAETFLKKYVSDKWREAETEVMKEEEQKVEA